MSHATIIINGRKLLDDDLDEYRQTPPETFRNLIKPGRPPEPHMKAAMIALTDALLAQQPIHIDIETWEHGWTMNVHHTHARIIT